MAGLGTGTNNAVRRPDLQWYVKEFFSPKGIDDFGFIAKRVLPVFMVNEKGSTYTVIPKEYWLKVEDTRRAPKGSFPRNSWTYETGLYNCIEYGWEEPMEDSERRDFDNANGGGSADFLAVERAMLILFRDRERRVASKVFDNVRFTPTTVIAPWSDATNAKPIDDIKNGKVIVRGKSGVVPESLIINWEVFENLKRTDQIVNLLRYEYGPDVNLTQLSSAQVASILGVKNFLVAGEVKDTADPGQPSVIEDIWSSSFAMLTSLKADMDTRKPQLGRTFLWSMTDIVPGFAQQMPAPAGQEGMPQMTIPTITEEYREEQTTSDIYRVRFHVDESLLASKEADGSTLKSDLAGAVTYLMDGVTV